MKPLKYTVAALALIAVASFTSSAMAAANIGDVIFGAYDLNSPGLGSFEFDLGAFSSLAPNETWNLGTAVESTYSTDSSANLQFNIAATGNSTVGTAEGLAAKEIAFTSQNFGTPSSLNTTMITNIANEDGAYGASTQTAISTPAGTAYLAAQGAGSFQTAIENGSGTNGNYGAGSTAGDWLSAYPSDGTNFTLYTKTSGTTAAVAYGTFVFSQVNGNDILTFDAAAVPEPSAYALALSALALFLVLKRRHKAA